MILTDENGNKYSVIGETGYMGNIIVSPLPTPPVKETYYIEMNDKKVKHNVLWEALDLNPPQAEALAKAIEALLQYCNDTPKNPAMPFFPKYLVDACEASRAAIQDGSAA